MFIGLIMLRIEKAPEDRKNTYGACLLLLLLLLLLLVIVLWLGLLRNKTLYPYLLSKLSILLLGVVARNSYR